MFSKATKKESKLRLSLIGPSGSGKTYTALRLAHRLAQGNKVAVLDSERGSASKYADKFPFDVCEPDDFSPQTYVKVLKAAEASGYSVLVVDSLSHEWMGRGGALEMVDKISASSRAGNSFSAWRSVTPVHNALIDAIVSCKMHVIATLRAKQEYVLEEDERGRKAPKKVGMGAVQRDGLEYEFDVVAELEPTNRFVVTKTRCSALQGYVATPATEEVADLLLGWLDGEKADDAPKVKAATPDEGVSLADELLGRLYAEDANLDELRKVIKSHIDSGSVTEDERKQLLSAYSERSKASRKEAHA